MTRREAAIARLQAEADQDRTACLKWWRETSAADKRRVWAAIQRKYDDPIMGLVSRFAQLGMTEMALVAEREGPP